MLGGGAPGEGAVSPGQTPRGLSPGRIAWAPCPSHSEDHIQRCSPHFVDENTEPGQPRRLPLEPQQRPCRAGAGKALSLGCRRPQGPREWEGRPRVGDVQGKPEAGPHSVLSSDPRSEENALSEVSAIPLLAAQRVGGRCSSACTRGPSSPAQHCVGGGSAPAPAADGRLDNQCGSPTRVGHHPAPETKTTLTGRTVDEPWKHYSKPKKPDAEDLVSCGSAHRGRPGHRPTRPLRGGDCPRRGRGKSHPLRGPGVPLGGRERLQLEGGLPGDALGATGLFAVKREFREM